MDRASARTFFSDIVALAPMAQGGNLPYRRLCREYGAVRTCSEMVLAHKLVKGGERPLLKHHPEETDFGVQLTSSRTEVMVEAVNIALEHGAQFIDLNFGCPIDLVCRKGAGAAMLKRPSRLADMVAGVRAVTDQPLSVKIRLGYTEEKMNCVKIAQLAEEAGADAVTVHGRTRAQRYRLSARWDLIDEVSRAVAIPVIGNGDLLTPWDLERRRSETGLSSFLVARGALIKPWIFKEMAEGQPWDPSVPERWQIMRRYVDLAMEHFGDDEFGLKRVQRFLLWHLKFWHRYHPWTEADFEAQLPDSLIQARNPEVTDGGDLTLLASDQESDHEVIWQRILDRDYPTA
jgi:tRNA-dihydrouridine synthase 3